MKKTPTAVRKHGYNARAAVIENRLKLSFNRESQTHKAECGPRVTTQLSCCKTGEAYFWITDRGRSRVIKH